MAVFLKEEIHPQSKSHKADLLLIHQATSVLFKKFISITHDHKELHSSFKKGKSHVQTLMIFAPTRFRYRVHTLLLETFG